MPSVPVVLNYCGLPWQRDENSLDVWWSGMRALAACPNVAVKVSELGLADRAWSEADNLGIIRETD
ncbi:MAG: amidohydrolase family protein [Microvirga sp.]